MPPSAHVEHGTDDQLIRWITLNGVAVEHWPRPPDTRPPAPIDTPVLYLVAVGAADPDADHELVDWVRLPVRSDELRARAETLLARARFAGAVLPSVDADDILRIGGELAVLSPLEGRLMRVLLDQSGRVVSRDVITAELWPGSPPADTHVLSNVVRRLRIHVAHLPLRVHTIHGRGFLLEVVPTSGPVPVVPTMR